MKQEAGNYSVERASDGAVLVIISGAIPESVCRIEPGEQYTFNIRYCFEAQCIHEYDDDGGFFLEKFNPHHLMVDTYSHSYQVDDVVICSVHFDTFTCTSDDTCTCTSSNSGVFCDHLIILPT